MQLNFYMTEVHAKLLNFAKCCYMLKGFRNIVYRLAYTNPYKHIFLQSTALKHLFLSNTHKDWRVPRPTPRPVKTQLTFPRSRETGNTVASFKDATISSSGTSLFVGRRG